VAGPAAWGAGVVAGAEAFRAHNRRLLAVESAVEGSDAVPFLCECGHWDCLRTVDVAADEYEAAHRHDDDYMIGTPHYRNADEQVVVETATYTVVRKPGLT
jgi:hypothetical protein